MNDVNAAAGWLRRAAMRCLGDTSDAAWPVGEGIGGVREDSKLLAKAYLEEHPDDDSDDICGFCGEHGADKIPHPVRWPGEESAGTDLVHAKCEDDECRRAHCVLTDRQREEFLMTIWSVPLRKRK